MACILVEDRGGRGRVDTVTAGVERFAIRAGHMFDGIRFHDGPVTVVVEDGRIAAVDPAGAAPRPDAALVDLGESTLLPGLVDAHTHLCWDPGGDPEDLAGASHDALVVRAREHAAAALRAGITTLRDLGDRDFATLALREEYRAGAVGPELLVAGPPLTRRGGHCWYLGGEAEGPDALVAAVHERAARGVDWIKVMATGGFTTTGTDPCRPQYDAEQLAVVVEAAHREGLPVTAHAHATAGITAAVAAGVDGIEHCTFLTESGVTASPDVVEAIVGRGVWCGITIGRVFPDTPDDIVELLEGVWRNIRRLMDSGARVAFSTDAGIDPNKRHDVFPDDLADLPRHGFTGAEVLTGATSAAAASCGLGHRKGRIAAGYDADVIAVAPGVEHDLAGLRDVRAVWRGGRRVQRG